MTPERISELQELCAKATEGPWEIALITRFTCSADASFIAAARTALPELLAEVTRITREQQEERADWYRFGTFMSQFDLGDKDGGTDAVVDSWIERITRLTRERDEAFNAGIEAAAVKSDHYAIKAQYRAASHDNPVARNAAWDKNEAGREIAIEIRALKKPATGQATGEK